MRPATHTLTIAEPTDVDSVIARVQARLDGEPAPPVQVERDADSVLFSSNTWGPILVTRVQDALDAELGPEGARRAFRPVGRTQ